MFWGFVWSTCQDCVQECVGLISGCSSFDESWNPNQIPNPNHTILLPPPTHTTNTPIPVLVNSCLLPGGGLVRIPDAKTVAKGGFPFIGVYRRLLAGSHSTAAGCSTCNDRPFSADVYLFQPPGSTWAGVGGQICRF